MGHFRAVLLTGASSGIGRALALACAGHGAILHLGGRDAARLEAVAEMCRARGADARPRTIDVRDATAITEWIRRAGHLDLVVANAGIGGGIDGGGPEGAAQVRALFATNLDGSLNVILGAIGHLAAQKPDASGVRGRIAAVASIAAFVAAPGAPSYCASKAALDAFMVATAPSAERVGLRLTSVCPGYVRTAMTEANPFPMPGLMDADRAARIILAGIAKGQRRIAFPWWLAFAAQIIGRLPPRLSAALLEQTRGKPPLPRNDSGDT